MVVGARIGGRCGDGCAVVLQGCHALIRIRNRIARCSRRAGSGGHTADSDCSGGCSRGGDGGRRNSQARASNPAHGPVRIASNESRAAELTLLLLGTYTAWKLLPIDEVTMAVLRSPNKVVRCGGLSGRPVSLSFGMMDGAGRKARKGMGEKSLTGMPSSPVRASPTRARVGSRVRSLLIAGDMMSMRSSYGCFVGAITVASFAILVGMLEPDCRYLHKE